MNMMIKKGWGRIYVMDHSQVGAVKKIVEDLDKYEWEYYIDGIIAPFPKDGKVQLVYTHKFEPCLDELTLACWKKGIAVWCITQQHEVFIPGARR